MAMTVWQGTVGGLQMAFFMFWDTLWPLVLGFGLSGAVQAFVSRARMQQLLGDHRPATLVRAGLFGMISSSCSYAAAAMSKSLFQKGADFTSAMVFMIASTNLVLELGLVLWILIGWQFAAAEYVGGIVMIALLALISRFFFEPRLVRAAADRLNSGAGSTEHEGHGAMAEETAGRRPRYLTLAGWADAAAYTMADLIMLRRELLIGYLVAGFLAVAVPATVWNVVFFRGHGAWTVIENSLVGPLIAVISFVCSIGNVPLAAALWTGGISFGGVVSFIFADLITMPLILIYRRLYGWSLTLRLVAAFWIVMSAAGLITEVLFGAVGLIPRVRPLRPVAIGLQWNYTTILNLVFLVVFAAIYWLYRNQARFGGGTRYAIDPVCGMQVERSLAPASTSVGGRPVYFCSDHCHDRFTAHPDRFKGGSPEVAGTDGESIDPVCGMTVTHASAAATREADGRVYLFCGTGCADAFDAEPERFRQPAPSAGPPGEQRRWK